MTILEIIDKNTKLGCDTKWEYADNPQVPIKTYEYSMEETQSML